MVDRWPTLDPIPSDPQPKPEPQKSAQDAFPPDKEFQGDMEIVTVTRGRYGEIKRTSRTVKENEPNLRNRPKAKKSRLAPARPRAGDETIE